MAIPKISTFVIAIIWVGFFVAAISIIMSNFILSYNTTPPTTNVQMYNHLTEINDMTSELQNTTVKIGEKTNPLDILEEYFDNGYSAIVISLKSLDLFKTMFSDGLANIGMPVIFQQELETAIIATIVILLVIGVLISVIVKKDV